MKKKEITIDDFEVVKWEVDYITWEEIERVLGKRKYKHFLKFMYGQTCIEQGAYVCDVNNFLRKPEHRFFD
jgi:hypothetical protein